MKSLLFASALAIGFTAPPIMAATFSNASFSNFVLTFEDLDPDDTITPSATFNRLDNISSIVGTVFFDGISAQSFQLNDFSTNLLTETVRDSSNEATAVLAGGSFTDTIMQAGGSSTGSNAEGMAGNFEADVFDFYSVFLSANTRLTITGNFLSSLIGTVGEGERASNQASLFLGSGGQTSLFEVSNQISPFQLGELAILSVVFDNTTSEFLSTTLSRGIVSTGSSSAPQANVPSPSAVPIPAALPLMASALGIFGLARRRNKSKAA